MDEAKVKQKIKSVLAVALETNFLEAVNLILEAMGYQSDRRLDLSGSPHEFIQEFPAENQETNSEMEFCKNAKSINLVFELTDDEIVPSLNLESSFEKGRLNSFYFVAVELTGASYSRSKYAEFTREINKRMKSPTVVFFKSNSGFITLAFVHQRRNKINPNRSVLGAASIVREINPSKPHPAHLEILKDLSLEQLCVWMQMQNKPENFDGLLEAWLAKLDLKELNASFYKELRRWFELALSENSTKFPVNEDSKLTKEAYLIRLITRILFIWFIKEKGLVAEELFSEPHITNHLKEYDRDSGDSYYRTILQNLFFATLNCKISNRQFGKPLVESDEYLSYLYESEINQPDILSSLFSKTPFINGGLFDCLDQIKKNSTEENRYTDCFSNEKSIYQLISVPNWLFFSDQSERKGLFTILDKYKFTIAENTPIEQEVALDPELLGSVFENLLAEFNPTESDSSRASARQRSGTYYTPRIIVDYMVEEALVEVLVQKITPTDLDKKFFDERLHYMFDYADAFDDAEILFDDREIDEILQSIAKLRIIDPAVGSGAFPMGVLHKLTLALKRLDPSNARWKNIQKQMALQKFSDVLDSNNSQQLSFQLQEISKNFLQHSSDFGRKLYLIQNSIFGVDIEPMACQIAKLRFFISLTIEQETREDTENFGFSPLPNLETRFIAADTLIDLQDGSIHEERHHKRNTAPLLQDTISSILDSNRSVEIRQNINVIRQKYFRANNKHEKLNCINEEKNCHVQLVQELEKQKTDWEKSEQNRINFRLSQIPLKYRNSEQIRLQKEWEKRKERLDSEFQESRKIANWDPYNQNVSVNFFNPKWMFNTDDGFDVVIGNPPYIQLQENAGELGKRYKKSGYQTFIQTGDIYQLFIERGCQLLLPDHGILSFITSNSWLQTNYGKLSRKFLCEVHSPLLLLDVGKDAFENTIVATCILILRHGKHNETCKGISIDGLVSGKLLPSKTKINKRVRLRGDSPWSILSSIEESIMDKIEEIGTPLNEWDISIYRGITTGCNDAFLIDDRKRNEILDEDPNSKALIKPILRGRDIHCYYTEWKDTWVITTFPSLHLDIEAYPGIKKHLLSFGKERLAQEGKKLVDGSKSRKKTTHSWFELQDTCGYHEEFRKEKIIWKRIG